MAFSELYGKAQAIIRALASCSVGGKILTSKELVDLLYVAYNRDCLLYTSLLAITDPEKQYLTAVDIIERGTTTREDVYKRQMLQKKIK